MAQLPKHPDQRARRGGRRGGQAMNKDFRIVEVEASTEDHTNLPDDLLGPGEEWHPGTVRWWSRLVESPILAELTDMSWSELEATALLHHQFMRKRTFTLASELRLRMGSFGATPADQMRLRILTQTADKGETGVPERPAAKRAPGLRAVD